MLLIIHLIVKNVNMKIENLLKNMDYHLFLYVKQG